MNPIFERSVEIVLAEIKELLRSSVLEDKDLTQEALADMLHTTQPSIHRWISYDLAHFPPVWIMSFLPESVVTPLCNFFLKRHGKRVFDIPGDLKTDGHIDDNILNIDVLIGEIIKLRREKPEKIIRACDRLLVEVMTMQQEAQQQIDAQKKSNLYSIK
jgi:hypothetical protein